MVVACLRTPKSYSTQKTRSRWLPATRETQVQRRNENVRKRNTKILGESSVHEGLPASVGFENVSVSRLLASSALRSRFLSSPVGVVWSNFITSFRQRIGPSWRVRTRQHRQPWISMIIFLTNHWNIRKTALRTTQNIENQWMSVDKKSV